VITAVCRGEVMGRDGEGKESDGKKERKGERLACCDKHGVEMATSLYDDCVIDVAQIRARNLSKQRDIEVVAWRPVLYADNQ